MANRTVDFEQVQWLNFTIRAQDHGSPPRIAELPVFMRIVDVNDNNPVFTQPSYQVARRQGGGGQLADPVGPLSGAACCLMTAAVYLARRSLSRALQSVISLHRPDGRVLENADTCLENVGPESESLS